jgi:hypothetical protein
MDTPEWINYQNQFDLSASYFQDIPKETNKFCVIVEPRKHPRLIPVIKNYVYLLQKKGWGLVIICGTANEEFVKKGIAGWANVKLVRMTTENITSNEYSDIFCSPTIWELLIGFGCKHSLIFQVDTVLLKDSVDEFLEYDYVGAPWCVKWLGLELGNGGLSLRNTYKMLEITRQCPRVANTFFGERHLTNEDIYFSFYLARFRTANMPSVEEALKFSVETVFYDDPCGMHQPHIDKFPSREAFAKLLSKRYIM